MPDKVNNSTIAGSSDWICVQLGAREHYAVARALHRRCVLNQLLTDFWHAPRRTFGFFADRFHPELENANVRSANLACAAFELTSRARNLTGWELIRRRNDWFQTFVVSELIRQPKIDQRKPINLIAYSYAAARVLKFAKEQSWTTVLCQIDPGPTEERIVARLYEQMGQDTSWHPAPTQYWDDWRGECELADRIVVNSHWSRNALIGEGIPAGKISMIPLAFEPSREAVALERHYPEVFTERRPLRVLFLGQINLRKGIAPLLDAVKLLAGESIEFWFVGPVQFQIPEQIRIQTRVKWFGPVPRRRVAEYYREADLFIFPTLSDGFGLTQLEAQAWKLPIVTSAYCGEVVQNGLNGIVLADVRAETIAEALLLLLRSPERLQSMSDHSGIAQKFGLQSLGLSLMNS